MEQRDYLKKQVDQLAKVLARILAELVGLKSTEEIGERMEICKQQLKDELDLEIDHLNSISEADFITSLYGKNNDALENLAHILLVMADHGKHEMMEEQRKELYKKSLTVFYFLEKRDVNYSYERYLTIERIKKSIDSI